jgi:hypothetical protein
MSNARLSILQARAVKDKRISDSQFRTLAALGMYADEDGWCYPLLQTLGNDLGKSKQAVGRDTIALRKLGYLEVRARFDKNGSRRSSLYRLRYDLPPVNVDDSTPSTPEVDTPSTPEVDVNDPSNDPKKRNKQKIQIKGIEAAMFANRTVTESDLQDPTERLALEAFERDMQLPASWQWYPAKASKEREWKAFREFVIKTYRADPKAFSKYNTWRNQPFVKGAKSNTQIKDYPADFEVSWSDYLRANPQASEQSRSVSVDDNGIPETY